MELYLVKIHLTKWSIIDIIVLEIKKRNKLMLYLYHHSDSHWNVPNEPSVGNHYELIDTDNIEEYDWERRQEHASNEDFNEEEQEWSDHVEEHGGSSNWVKYDNTDPVHMKHKGYEDQRPGVAEYHEVLAHVRKEREISQIEKTIQSNMDAIRDLTQRNCDLAQQIKDLNETN